MYSKDESLHPTRVHLVDTAFGLTIGDVLVCGSEEGLPEHPSIYASWPTCALTSCRVAPS